MRWIVVCLLLAGCGSDSSSDPDAEPSESRGETESGRSDDRSSGTVAAIPGGVADLFSLSPQADQMALLAGRDVRIVGIRGADGASWSLESDPRLVTWSADGTSLGVLDATESGRNRLRVYAASDGSMTSELEFEIPPNPDAGQADPTPAAVLPGAGAFLVETGAGLYEIQSGQASLVKGNGPWFAERSTSELAQLADGVLKAGGDETPVPCWTSTLAWDRTNGRIALVCDGGGTQTLHLVGLGTGAELASEKAPGHVARIALASSGAVVVLTEGEVKMWKPEIDTR